MVETWSEAWSVGKLKKFRKEQSARTLCLRLGNGEGGVAYAVLIWKALVAPEPLGRTVKEIYQLELGERELTKQHTEWQRWWHGVG